jgi:hypothetical protein
MVRVARLWPVHRIRVSVVLASDLEDLSVAFKKQLTPIGRSKRGKGITMHRGKGSTQQHVPTGDKTDLTSGAIGDRNQNDYGKPIPIPPTASPSPPPMGGMMLDSDESDTLAQQSNGTT